LIKAEILLEHFLIDTISAF